MCSVFPILNNFQYLAPFTSLFPPQFKTTVFLQITNIELIVQQMMAEQTIEMVV